MWSVLGIPMCVNEQDMCFYMTQGWKDWAPSLFCAFLYADLSI